LTVQSDEATNFLNEEKDEKPPASLFLEENYLSPISEIKRAQRMFIGFCVVMIFMGIANFLHPIAFTICAVCMTLFLNNAVKIGNKNIYQSPPISSVGYVLTLQALIWLMTITIATFLSSALETLLGMEESARLSAEMSKMGRTYSKYGEYSFFMCVNLILLVPLYEELFFRGYLLQTYRRIGDSFAIFMSTLLFAVLHGDFFHSVYAFFVGLAFSVLAVRYNSIIPSFLFHIINNSVLLLRLMDASEQIQATQEIAEAEPRLLWESLIFCLGALYLFYRICKRLRRQSEKGVRVTLTYRESRRIFLHWPVVLVMGLFFIGFLFHEVPWIKLLWSLYNNAGY
jgi:membrane protease YdiL (CAAX protease family)